MEAGRSGPYIKKGAKNRPENYRPVSQTSAPEHIITSRTMKHLDNLHILTDAQHGLRKSRFCESQLIIRLQNLAKDH
jgi:hypothetical protein